MTAIEPDPIGTAHPTAGIPDGWGRVTGKLGPGLPRQLGAPQMVLTFTRGDETLSTTAIGGGYEIELPPGTWTVRGPSVCASGLTVAAGWQRDDLLWPLAGCQSLR